MGEAPRAPGTGVGALPPPLVAITNCAARIPVADGVNRRSALHAAPGATSSPDLHWPERPNSLACPPSNASEAMVTVAPPSFLNITRCVVDAVETGTMPKSTLDGDTASGRTRGPGFGRLSPGHGQRTPPPAVPRPPQART